MGEAIDVREFSSVDTLVADFSGSDEPLPQFDLEAPITELPYLVRREYEELAAQLLQDLREYHLKVVLTPAPISKFDGHMIRSVVEENIPWYKALWGRYGDKLKRHQMEAALERIAQGEGPIRRYIREELGDILDSKEIKNPDLRRELRRIARQDYVPDEALQVELMRVARKSIPTDADVRADYRRVSKGQEAKNPYLQTRLEKVAAKERLDPGELSKVGQELRTELRVVERLRRKYFRNDAHLAMARETIHEALMDGYEHPQAEAAFGVPQIPPNETVRIYFEQGKILEPKPDNVVYLSERLPAANDVPF